MAKVEDILSQARREKDALEQEISGLKQEMADLQILLESHSDYDKINIGEFEVDHYANQAEKDLSTERTRVINTARKKFNQNPNKGVKYLVEHAILEETPREVAKFLYNGKPDNDDGPGFSSVAIGEYLGENKQFQLDVLNEFVECFDFKNKEFDKALRDFLARFRLPGEAQKIDRMMEAWAKKYISEVDHDIFKSPDTVYVLAFSTIMLQTDLHNPSVKNKMSTEMFLKNNRGINEGQNMPNDFLLNLYNNILTEPLALPEAVEDDLSYTFFNPEREGFLIKQGGRRKNWKRRWFILTGNCLYYFKVAGDKQPCGIIPLENLDVREVIINGKRNCFELYNPIENSVIKACKTNAGVLSEGHHSTYVMCASSLEEKESWMDNIRRAAIKDPFYELLKMRRDRCINKK